MNTCNRFRTRERRRWFTWNAGKALQLSGLCASVMIGSMVAGGHALAGCGLTLQFDNDLSKSITVLNIESKTSTGKWKSVYGEDFTVKSGKKVSKAIETNASCMMPHHLRVKYEQGKSTLYKTKGPLGTAVDKKYTFEFDD
ncbi:MAG: hypothetical protein MRJ96_09575 [Nitrospirales bacterium]|nr:hypothetical protein [Nitrospira sp.]MDR4501684.1 hypothetical protein [Nitrospirales bacterium]